MSYKVINITSGDLHFRGLRFSTGGSVHVATLDPRHRELKKRAMVSILNLQDDSNELEYLDDATETPTIPEAEPAPAPVVEPPVEPTGGAVDAELNTQQAPAVSSDGVGAAGGDSVPPAASQPEPVAPRAPEPTPAPGPMVRPQGGNPNKPSR